jgi:hypothetical protein
VLYMYLDLTIYFIAFGMGQGYPSEKEWAKENTKKKSTQNGEKRKNRKKIIRNNASKKNVFPKSYIVFQQYILCNFP